MNAIDSPTLTQSFEVIRSKLRDPEFLACHGLGNEVPFHVFPYDAGSELEVRALLRDLMSEDPAGLAPARITHIDLWELICDLCEQRGLMEKLPAFERKRGSDALLARLQTIASPAKLVEHMRERFAAAHGEPQPGRDVLRSILNISQSVKQWDAPTPSRGRTRSSSARSPSSRTSPLSCSTRACTTGRHSGSSAR